MQNPMEIPHWDGLTVDEFLEHIGVSDNLHDTLRAIEKYNVEAVHVFIGGKRYTANTQIDGIRPEDAIEKLVVCGIAWDGSDWEWGKTISGNDDPAKVLEALDAAREEFAVAVADYEAEYGNGEWDDDIDDIDDIEPSGNPFPDLPKAGNPFGYGQF